MSSEILPIGDHTPETPTSGFRRTSFRHAVSMLKEEGYRRRFVPDATDRHGREHYTYKFLKRKPGESDKAVSRRAWAQPRKSSDSFRRRPLMVVSSWKRHGVQEAAKHRSQANSVFAIRKMVELRITMA
jgi:hypothetical protein